MEFGPKGAKVGEIFGQDPTPRLFLFARKDGERGSDTAHNSGTQLSWLVGWWALLTTAQLPTLTTPKDRQTGKPQEGQKLEKQDTDCRTQANGESARKQCSYGIPCFPVYAVTTQGKVRYLVFLFLSIRRLVIFFLPRASFLPHGVSMEGRYLPASVAILRMKPGYLSVPKVPYVSMYLGMYPYVPKVPYLMPTDGFNDTHPKYCSHLRKHAKHNNAWLLSQSRTKIEQARKMRCFQQVTVATTSFSSLVSRSPTGSQTRSPGHLSPAAMPDVKFQKGRIRTCPPPPPLTGRFPAKHTHTPAHPYTTAASIGTPARENMPSLEPKWIMEAAFEAEPSFLTQILDPQEKGGDSGGDVSDRKTPANRNLTTSNRRLPPTPPRVLRTATKLSFSPGGGEQEPFKLAVCYRRSDQRSGLLIAMALSVSINAAPDTRSPQGNLFSRTEGPVWLEDWTRWAGLDCIWALNLGRIRGVSRAARTLTTTLTPLSLNTAIGKRRWERKGKDGDGTSNILEQGAIMEPSSTRGALLRTAYRWESVSPAVNEASASQPASTFLQPPDIILAIRPVTALTDACQPFLSLCRLQAPSPSVRLCLLTLAKQPDRKIMPHEHDPQEAGLRAATYAFPSVSEAAAIICTTANWTTTSTLDMSVMPPSPPLRVCWGSGYRDSFLQRSYNSSNQPFCVLTPPFPGGLALALRYFRLGTEPLNLLFSPSPFGKGNATDRSIHGVWYSVLSRLYYPFCFTLNGTITTNRTKQSLTSLYAERSSSMLPAGFVGSLHFANGIQEQPGTGVPPHRFLEYTHLNKYHVSIEQTRFTRCSASVTVLSCNEAGAVSPAYLTSGRLLSRTRRKTPVFLIGAYAGPKAELSLSLEPAHVIRLSPLNHDKPTMTSSFFSPLTLRTPEHGIPGPWEQYFAGPIISGNADRKSSEPIRCTECHCSCCPGHGCWVEEPETNLNISEGYPRLSRTLQPVQRQLSEPELSWAATANEVQTTGPSLPSLRSIPVQAAYLVDMERRANCREMLIESWGGLPFHPPRLQDRSRLFAIIRGHGTNLLHFAGLITNRGDALAALQLPHVVAPDLPNRHGPPQSFLLGIRKERHFFLPHFSTLTSSRRLGWPRFIRNRLPLVPHLPSLQWFDLGATKCWAFPFPMERTQISLCERETDRIRPPPFRGPLTGKQVAGGISRLWPSDHRFGLSLPLVRTDTPYDLMIFSSSMYGLGSWMGCLFSLLSPIFCPLSFSVFLMPVIHAGDVSYLLDQKLSPSRPDLTGPMWITSLFFFFCRLQLERDNSSSRLAHHLSPLRAFAGLTGRAQPKGRLSMQKPLPESETLLEREAFVDGLMPLKHHTGTRIYSYATWRPYETGHSRGGCRSSAQLWLKRFFSHTNPADENSECKCIGDGEPDFIIPILPSVTDYGYKSASLQVCAFVGQHRGAGCAEQRYLFTFCFLTRPLSLREAVEPTGKISRTWVVFILGSFGRGGPLAGFAGALPYAGNLTTYGQVWFERERERDRERETRASFGFGYHDGKCYLCLALDQSENSNGGVGATVKNIWIVGNGRSYAVVAGYLPTLYIDGCQVLRR
ncbi:hypothetical protein CCUS01_17406 [Colletotrichum cuscutae]|uniref:Uncharacterized protein n=1 Tax=Colletotrichum cuscutae TaxID=1209917 RepID=A0AAI9V7N7_9PEZI|nr:hypothetical protein CCUS01_17406 [Colletotrichum cuscutae]